MTDSESLNSPLMDDMVSMVSLDDTPSSDQQRTRGYHRPPLNGRSRRVLRRSLSEIETSYQPIDWASDDGVRLDGIELQGSDSRRTLSDSMTSPGYYNEKIKSQVLNKSDQPIRNMKKVESSNFDSSRVSTSTPTLLHGKNILQIMAIDSIEPIARYSNSVDWSENLEPADEAEDMSLMDPHYDLTSARMIKLFSLFHPAENGMVSYQGFRSGLQAMGIACGNDEQFQAFIDNVDDDKSGGITYQEFLYAIQEIKLAQLFNEKFLKNIPPEYINVKRSKAKKALLGSIEYSPDRIRSVYPIDNVQKFIYSTRPSWATVRWINIEGIDSLLMRRLSVRYFLHPLAIEDTLDADVERPKYEEYDEHSSLVLQTIHARDLSMVKNYQRMYRASLYVQDGDKSPFEDMTKKELEERLEQLNIGCVMTAPQQLSLYILKDVLISVQEHPNTLWSVLKQRLDRSYSKVRQHGTAFLVYTIVDVCVDELTPITHTFGSKLIMLERLLSLDPRYFDISRLAMCSKQIKGLQVLCKPISEVIIQLSESEEFEGESVRYFRDVLDHITTIEEDCVRHLDRCRSLIDDFHNARAAQQNDVTYILALVAAVFLPAQFLTGLYGMNFTNMPELRNQNGYYIWWAVVLVLAFSTVAFFKFYKKWL
ncbi:metal ion transporter family [Plasmopara halstedii]|uniref:Metal ion transporter family n=1 Tax=Plasmopara halstedii TaxID=4781 RepID=A0A0P1AMA3_PLAHL|nr:metal ion transporter family [Plasmopara halstedii]CEG41869.1 metal ion transporter family [Plasmopara halstedii]|eukprot:XP_024578238.1 metal ion transporter family [Plasmopara halstedii]